MRILITWLALSLPLSWVWANEGRYVEIKLDKFDYLRPLDMSKGNEAGKLNFNYVDLSWDGMNLYLENKKLDILGPDKKTVENGRKVFDADVLISPDYLRFKSDYLNLGFAISPQSTFHDISKLKVMDSVFEIYDDYFQFSGKKFYFSDGFSHLELFDFNAYCQGVDDLAMTTPEGIIAGCLSNVILNANQAGGLAGAKIRYQGKTGNASFTLEGRLKVISIKNGLINGDFDKGSLSFDQFDIATAGGEINCLKDVSVITLEKEKLISDCLNSLKVQSKKIVVKNGAEGTRFFLNIKDMGVRNEDFSVDFPDLQVTNKEKSSTIYGLEIDCTKKKDTDLFDIKSVLQDCFIDGRLSAKRITTTDELNLYDKYDAIIGGFDPIDAVKKVRSKVKDLTIEVTDNNVHIKSRVKAVGMTTVEIWGTITVSKFKEKTRIGINVKDARLGNMGKNGKGFGSWTSKHIILAAINLALVDGEAIDADGDYIYITF